MGIFGKPWPPDGPPFQDGPPLLATLQALMKERDRQTAWIFPPDDPSGDDCSDTEYVPEDDDPLNCLVKEPAYLPDQPNSGLHKRVSIESVEKTVEETNTITLTQSGVELTISQNRKKTVKKSVERPAPTTLIDPAHVDDIEKLRHAIDPSTGMINLANVENPVWDFITVPPPDNPQEVTFEEFYGFPSRSQPVNETPVVSPNEPKLGEASPRPKQPRFTISLDDSSEECPAEESSDSDPSESIQIGAIDVAQDQARQWARQAWKVASRLNNEQLHRILRNKGQKQSETQFISTLISSRNSIKKLERVVFCPFSALLPRIGQVPQEGLSLSFPTSSIMSISDEELTTLCQESDTKTLNGFKAKETIFSLPPPSKQPGQTPKAPRGSTVGTRGPLPKSKRGQPTDGPPSITPSMAGTQMPSRQDRDTNLILANLKGQTALPTVEGHLLPPPLRTISNKKIDVEALDGVEYTEDLGYVFWDEDDTTKHLNAASQLLKHHFAKIAQLLAERDVNFENVDTAVWRLSATPYVLKTKKPKKPKGEQPFQWKPPTEDVSESPRLGRAEKKKIETLVAKGKPSRALKELSKVIHPVPEIPFEDMVQIIQALHNADDPRQLTLQDLGEPREGWDLERENVEIQLQRLNSNSTASLDGITAELLKRSATHLKPVSALIGAVISECLEKGFVPTAWCLVRMVGIPKAKGGVRPISVQHSLKKLMARVLLQRNRQWFLDRIHPRQRGVGHPNGIEEIVFAVGDALDGAIAQKTNLVVAALDMSNAYQCVRRQLLIDKIVQLDHHDPQLVQFLTQAFSKEKLVLDSHGQRAVIHNTRGVQQGCPLSPALFALYLTRCMSEAETPDGAVQVWGYLDDLVIVASSLQTLTSSMVRLHNSLSEHGLQLNPAKTVAVSILEGQISTAPFGLMGSTITPTTSMYLLGTLLTRDQNERDQMFFAKVKKSDDLLPFLGLLSHQTHLLLLRQCINVRPLHLLRTLPISGHVLRQADDLLITHLLTFFHLPQSNSILIHANVEDGGLGFSSFAGSNIPSLVHAMTSRRPFLWQANPNPSGAPFQLGQEPPSSTFSPLQMVISVISMLNPDQFEKARRGQGKMVRLLEKDKLTQWRDPLPDWAQNRHATICASRAHFWVTMMPVDKFHVLDNDTILNSLNYRMLKEPTSYELGKTLLDKQGRNLNYSVPCPLCSVQFRVDHASCCQINGSARTARHTTIKLWLNRLLQQIPNVVTELEKPVWMDGINLGTKPRPAGAIADIRVTITTQVSNHKFVTNLLQGGDRSGNTLTFGLDLTIAQDIPNALHRGLLPDPRTAVNQAEEGKFKHYKKLGQEHKVIGIGISENGQLGNNMELFLDFMKKVARDGHKSAQVYHFLQMTSLVLEQSRCIMERRSLPLNLLFLALLRAQWLS
ncbi:putative Reverse transcriptase (RNA-dependent DNA polymerase) [Blattamonas nauphoetae]|uniref:Reverse transcriptase (RNA-dependent DNA polymerase) n=1 Tax=Blattamonas nauphoetae TaxID=2049346 RepID=A0ABQ9X4Q4_9EUKA|nr:putative Reverse transcriptase (RNA-dependent DNA polymerase) [Blattamonas nauphoetae]